MIMMRKERKREREKRERERERERSLPMYIKISTSTKQRIRMASTMVRKIQGLEGGMLSSTSESLSTSASKGSSFDCTSLGSSSFKAAYEGWFCASASVPEAERDA